MSLSKVVTLLFIGVVGGILIAPAKGSETRRKLSRLFNDVSDSVQDVIDLFHDTDKDLPGESVEQMGNLANQ